MRITKRITHVTTHASQVEAGSNVLLSPPCTKVQHLGRHTLRNAVRAFIILCVSPTCSRRARAISFVIADEVTSVWPEESRLVGRVLAEFTVTKELVSEVKPPHQG